MLFRASGNDYFPFYVANQIVITQKSVRVANDGKKTLLFTKPTWTQLSEPVCETQNIYVAIFAILKAS